ncbi:MAG: gamma-glutamyltransferase [Calditrichaeota bacterium]|nr:gamma-glutamyltransferase [Calditrichota bacterium]
MRSIEFTDQSALRLRESTWLSILSGLILLAGCAPKWKVSPPVVAPPAVESSEGMVVAAHPLAAEAGVEIIRQGGNAVDAALAALFMLNVVEPHASGLGGGGFGLVRMSDGEARIVVYRERAPRQADPAIYYDPADSLHRLRGGGASVAVPGAPAGWAELHSRWATMPLEKLADQSVRTARDGFPVDPTLAQLTKDYFTLLSSDSLLREVFLKDGLPMEPGDTLRQPALAATLESLTRKGLGSFYRGPIAEAVVSAVQQKGGFLTAEDLEYYRCDVVDPLIGKFRDVELLTAPPPASGGAALLEGLALIEATDATRDGFDAPWTTHQMAQALQQTNADAAFWGDDFPGTMTGAKLLDPERIRKATAGIEPKSTPGARTAIPIDLSTPGNTTHLVVVDRHGNVVSLTQSINYFFGAGVMAGETGLLLNNQMADFSAPPDSNNLVAPRRRPRSNMAPLIALRNGRPILALGTPGGARIVPTMMQLTVNLFDFEMGISQAIDAPRFNAVHHQIVLENRRDPRRLTALKRLGYQVQTAPPFHLYFGGAHGIWIDPVSGMLFGAADRRRGGAARGL